ncbi:MAG: hypothetical protein SGI89_10040 [bacterium]|nr:hypothetical protein [bacterium]
MSLDTVLKIGKAFRESANGLKYHKYIKPCPKDTDKESVIRFSLPVNDDFSFDFDNLSEITDENIIGSESKDSELYYLRFKTSDNDSSPSKYLFGDIFYKINEGKEENIKTAIVENNSSFENWDKFIQKELIDKLSKLVSKNKITEISLLKESAMNQFHELEIVKKFRKSYQKHETEIENIIFYSQAIINKSIKGKLNLDILKDDNILRISTAELMFNKINSEKTSKSKLEKIFNNEFMSWDEINSSSTNIDLLINKVYKNQVFLHFDFSQTILNKKYWHEFNELIYITGGIFTDFFTENSISGKVLNKTLYKTLCSGDDKNDIQFPNFSGNEKHKSKSFTEDEVKDLFYAIDYSKKAVISPTADVKLIVLPNGDNLKAEDYEKFQQNAFSLTSEVLANRKNTEIKINDDILLSWFDEASENESVVTHFDMVFSKKGGMTTPDTDLIELSGVSKSSLQQIRERIRNTTIEILSKRKKEIQSDKLISPSINWSFSQLMGSPQADSNGKIQFKVNPRYQTHLLKILPQIYCGTYHIDNLILPSFISNVEYSIRHGDSKFKLLKYDLEFILSIQNTKTYKSNYMKIVESESYQIGLLLGKLSQNFAGENSPIKSFEKNNVGNLTRKIPTLKDFIEFKNDVEQKLIMHEKNKYTFKLSSELSEKVKQFTGIYDKQECAFGFFESYYSSFKTTPITENN